MSVIFRYELPIDDEWHEFPDGQIVFATPYRKFSRDRLEVWVEHVEGYGSRESVWLRVFGTGHHTPSGVRHVESVRDDPLIWHIFQKAVEGKIE